VGFFWRLHECSPPASFGVGLAKMLDGAAARNSSPPHDLVEPLAQLRHPDLVAGRIPESGVIP
jgi:hypothetical protein